MKPVQAFLMGIVMALLSGAASAYVVLVRLDERMAFIKETVGDHETRLRVIETGPIQRSKRP